MAGVYLTIIMYRNAFSAMMYMNLSGAWITKNTRHEGLVPCAQNPPTHRKGDRVTEILKASEQADLAQLEAVIERGMNTFIEVGAALYTIRDQRLYRSDFETFEAYCQERWGFSDSRARQLIGAAQTVTTVTAGGLPAPTSERQARELSRVPESERAEVWRETVERTEGNPTAAAVRETYEAARPALDENVWVEPGTDEVVDAELIDEPTDPEPPKAKRRPLPEAFTDAGRDLARAAERLDRLTEDDRFTKNRETTHHQLPELLGALDHTAHLVQAMRLDQAQASEEARRWWATSLNKISDALRDVAHSIEQEQ
jgi:hypothetical protein